MYKEGTKLVLTLPITGKTMQFEQGLKGKIVEYINPNYALRVKQ